MTRVARFKNAAAVKGLSATVKGLSVAMHCLVLILAGAMAPARAQAQDIAVSNGAGAQFRNLAPIQLYSVPEVDVAPPVSLPPPQSDPSQDPSQDPLHDLLLPAEGEGGNDTSPIPDISYDLFWGPDDMDAWHRHYVSPSSPGLRGSASWRRSRRPGSRWLPAPSTRPWTFGTRNWRYAGDGGMSVVLGSKDVAAPAWGSTARLGGISVSQSSAVAVGEPHSWQYSMSVGALDYASDRAEGDLSYGPTASNTAVRYGLGSGFNLESQLELAPDLITTGIGGEYDARGWGVWSAGVARAHRGIEQGWRYQAAYRIEVMDDVQLSWMNERHSDGFADLSRYQGGSTYPGGIRQQWGATIGLGRWGDLRGVYENEHPSLGDTRHSFGLTQQFWYSPNLRIGLEAQRELISGDYDVGIRFSVPIR